MSHPPSHQAEADGLVARDVALDAEAADLLQAATRPLGVTRQALGDALGPQRLERGGGRGATLLPIAVRAASRGRGVPAASRRLAGEEAGASA